MRISLDRREFISANLKGPNMKSTLLALAAGVLAIAIGSLCTTTAGGAEARTSQASRGSAAARLIGTWRLVKFVNTDPSGKVSHPYGTAPLGYFVYGPTGHLSIQIMRTPATRPFASGDDDKGTDAEIRSAFDGYVAYFGTYRVDEANGVLTHVVEGSLKPSYTGTEQPRPFTLEDDRLIIEVRENGWDYYRELQRVK
jgi:hypothetical protein